MNILFLTLLDFVTIEEKGIYTDLIREFVRNGHKVYIISPTERRKREKTRLIDNDNHKILKLRIGNVQKANLAEKFVSTLALEMNYRRSLKQYFSDVRFDLVLYSTPPITLQKPIKYIKDRDEAKTYLLLKDIFPQNAVDLNMMSQHGITAPVYKYFRVRERILYEISDYIGCMSQANVDYLAKHNPYLPAGRIEVCPNSIEPSYTYITEHMKLELRQKYGLPLEKTVFIYGGNLGKPQGIDFIIECLRANRVNDKVHFIIVGSGTEFSKLRAYCNEEEQSNFQLFNQMSKDEYDDLIKSCDVGLIFLDRRFTIPNFPSRLLSYMQASIPVLAATDKNTDIGKVIEKGHFGYSCESGDTRVFNQLLHKLCNKSLREEMGRNGRDYLENNYTVKRSYEIIMSHFI
jgi:glycosyltransferase involved in cell wall biosynthesis